MFKAIIGGFMSAVASLLQVILFPINLAITSALPNISSFLISVGTGLAHIFNAMAWGLSLIPNSLLTVLLFILTIEIFKHSVYLATHAIIKVYNIIQKVKFW